jgi:hypothetical protein
MMNAFLGCSFQKTNKEGAGRYCRSLLMRSLCTYIRMSHLVRQGGPSLPDAAAKLDRWAPEMGQGFTLKRHIRLELWRCMGVRRPTRCCRVLILAILAFGLLLRSQQHYVLNACPAALILAWRPSAGPFKPLRFYVILWHWCQSVALNAQKSSFTKLEPLWRCAWAWRGAAWRGGGPGRCFHKLFM